jgi:Xaa-Pro aminopeptidase
MSPNRTAAVLLGLALSVAPSSAQSDDVRSLERTGSGAPVCGLGKEFHAGRRKALRESLAEQGGGVFVLRGLPAPRDYRPFSQDKMFWYLTGVESPGVAVVIDAASEREILLLPPHDPIGEVWNGQRWDVGDEWVRELSGFAEIRGVKDLVAVAAELAGDGGAVWTSLQPHVGLTSAYDSARGFDREQERDKLDGRVSREKAFQAALAAELGRDVKDASDALNALRFVKQPEEIAAIRRASRAGGLAIAEAMRSTRPGVGEWELAPLMTFIQTREGATGPAYGAIVGSGPNSCALHYLMASRRMQKGEPILVDYGPEVDHYVTDITRTWPVSGKFEGRLKELYEAVLAAQKAGIAAAKPGATMGDVDAASRAKLDELGFGRLLNHGVCHSVGMEVHDPGPRGARLEPGVVFTIEPGAYDAQLGIGVRIEDVVVITADGCDVLTSDAPKEIQSIEALMKKDGLLDHLD